MSAGTEHVPGSWQTVELHELAMVHYGKALAAGVRVTEGRVPVVGSSGVVGHHNEALVAEPCLVVGRKGAAGSVHLVNDPCWPIDTVYFIQPPTDIKLVYLSNFLSICELGSLDKSTAIPSLSRDDLYRVRVPVAPAAEQTRIVAKLEELLSDLDAGVAELKTAQKKLVQYRQSLLKAAVEGVLTAGWRRHNTPAETGAQLLERILAERRGRWEARQLAKFEAQGKAPPKDWQKKYPEPVQPDTADLPELPEGWVWASVDQLASIGTGVTPLRSKAIFFEGGEVPWVTSGALNQEMVSVAFDFVTPTAVKECRLDLYPVGTLLVAMYGEGKTRGKCSELAIPATINQAIAAIVLEGCALECKAHLKSFLLKSYEDMRKHASGGVQPNLNLQIIKTVAVPLPPAKEQQSIQSLLSVHLEAAREQLAAIETALHQSSAQRQNILRAAFAGQLVPQDPNDEPASALLERIRDQRGAQAGAKKPRGRKAKETSHA